MRASVGGIMGFDFAAVLTLARARGLDEDLAAELLPYADRGLMLAMAEFRKEHEPKDADG